jgi:hypothetical protein
VLDFFKGVLRKGELLPGSFGLGQAPAHSNAPVDIYSTVLSGVRALSLHFLLCYFLCSSTSAGMSP